jgi:phage tail sheath protein FI
VSAPFGEAGKARFVTGAESTLTSAEASTLADGAISPVRVMLGGVRLYDWRSLSADEANWKFLTYRDLVNDVAYRTSRTVEAYVGRNIDAHGHLFSELENALSSILEPIHAADGLYEMRDAAGNLIDPGYKVITDSPVNTAATIQAGQVNARIELRPSPSAELVQIDISKATLANSL